MCIFFFSEFSLEREFHKNKSLWKRYFSASSKEAKRILQEKKCNVLFTKKTNKNKKN